jgi:protein transport protein SEC31
MKLFDIDRSAVAAWSPVPSNPAFLATGTVAGTMGIDFDTSAHLEIFVADIANSDGANTRQLTSLGRTDASERFHKLAWGLTGTQSGTFPYGLLAGGLANGTVCIWDPAKIIRYFQKRRTAQYAH